MPGMNGMNDYGYQAALPDTRVLVLTLHKTEEFIRASLKAGADGYVLRKQRPVNCSLRYAACRAARRT